MMHKTPTLSYPYITGYASGRGDGRARYSASLMAQRGLYVINETATLEDITIPETSEELLELLNDDDKREKVFGDAEKTKEFLNAYNKAANQKSGDISKQIANDAAATIMDMLKDNGVDGRVPQEVLDHQVNIENLIQNLVDGRPAPIRPSAERNAAYNKLAPGAPLDKVLDDLGVFAKLINPKIPHRSDEERQMFSQITEVQNQYSSNDPASAGFLIPERMRSEIVQLALEQSVVRSRATVITMTSLKQKIPYVDAQSHADSVFGGMVFFWTEESGEIVTTKAKFGRMELDAKKLTGGARVPNELWNDASALSTWLTAALPSGLAYYEDLAFLTGSGAGEPLGFYNSDAVIEVTRDTANEIHPIDIFTMFSRMLPQSMARGVWVANQTTLPQLLNLKIVIQNVAGSENVGGSWVGLVQGSNIAGSPVLSILGRPLLISEKNPALGSAGDLAFVDFSHYLIGDRQAVSMDTSEHSRFMHDERELRVIERVDGRPWLPAAVTPKNGDTLSPVVKLAA